MRTITNLNPPESPARCSRSRRPALRVGLVQHRWAADALEERLTEAIGVAAGHGATAVFLPELTLSRYPAAARGGPDAWRGSEHLDSGPTYAFASRAAKQHGVLVHASLYERADAGDGLGLNTAILVGADGELIGRTRKLHIPISPGYHEDTYFRPGDAGDSYPVYRLGALRGTAIGLPTCWDEWFPESRAATRSRAPRCWSTRPRSAPNPRSPRSTPSRCGSR